MHSAKRGLGKILFYPGVHISLCFQKNFANSNLIVANGFHQWSHHAVRTKKSRFTKQNQEKRLSPSASHVHERRMS
jgi:hypothetical protein